MEVVEVLVVVGQRPQGLGDLAQTARVRLAGRGPLLVVQLVVGFTVLGAAALAGEAGVLRRGEVLLVLPGVDQPPAPGGDVHHEADDHEVGERGQSVGDRGADHGVPHPHGAPGAGAPQPGQESEGGQREDRGPLRAEGQPEADPTQQEPRPPQQPTHRPPGPNGAYDAVDRLEQPLQPGSHPVAVVDHTGDPAEHEEGQEYVEQGQPGQHEVEAVQAQQQTGDQRKRQRSGQSQRQPAHHQHHQRPDDGRGDPPAERIHAEGLLAQTDQPLADLRVHDQRRVVGPDPARAPGEDRVVDVLLAHALIAECLGVVQDVPVVDQRPPVLGVVRLVEGEPGRGPEVVEPHQEREHGDPDGGGPGEPPALGDPGPHVRGHSRRLLAVGGAAHGADMIGT